MKTVFNTQNRSLVFGVPSFFASRTDLDISVKTIY